MPYLVINQHHTNDHSLPSIDTYADAILRTFASLKPQSSYISRKHNCMRSPLTTLIDRSWDNQVLRIPSSLSSSSSTSVRADQLILEAHLPLASNKSKQLAKFRRLLRRLDQYYNRKEMSTKTLLPSSTHLNDRYFFHSNSSDQTRLATKHQSDNPSPSSAKRYKFSSNNVNPSQNEIYHFSTNQIEQRSHSSDSHRYHFPPDHTMDQSNSALRYVRSGSSLEKHPMKFTEETSTTISDTPYLFSQTTESLRYPNTISTFIHPDDSWRYQRSYPPRISNTILDFPQRASSLSCGYQPSTRMDTTTSTNGSLSILKRSAIAKSTTVHFQPSATVRSYLNEARERLLGKRRTQSSESFEKCVDRLVLSVNKKYGQQHQQLPSSSSTVTSSLNYISQYYAKEEELLIDYPIENDNDQRRLYSSLNTNRIHTQIMKNVNKSLLDRSYQIDQNRWKYLEHNVRRYLRLYENQSLQRELNYNLIRCFSASYLEDLRREEIRQTQIRHQMRAYTYEDIQDIYVPSVLEAYKMKTAIDREKHQRAQSSIPTGQLSPTSSSGYSPIMIGSLNENMDTQIETFETDQRSFLSITQTPANIRLSVDVFYEIMQESFRGVDASIAGHVSKASQYTKQQSPVKTRDYDSDIDIKSNSSFWSDEDDGQHLEDIHSRKSIPHQRKISRYLSTVNRSLLDRPSNLIADFYLSQLNRNMQESVQHIENIARDKARKHEIIDGSKARLNRSLSAEHLYQVRKEHLRYKQPFNTPTSFTVEDVADIYKPSILENYKRKIAIELERRRRQRQGQLISGPSSPPICTSDKDSSKNILKSSPALIIDPRRAQTRPDFTVVSPPTIVQRKEIIMGRARQTLTNDGNDHFIHQVGTTFPPSIYSDARQSSSQRRITLTATINDQYETPFVTNVQSLDFIDEKQMRIRHERDPSDEMTDGIVHGSKQVITSHPLVTIPQRPQTKIYTYIPPTEPIRICRANLIESDDDDHHHLSIVNIHQNIPLQQLRHLEIPVNNYQHASIINSSEQPLLLVDQSYNEQVTSYTEQQPKHEHGILIVSRDEHIAKIQEDISVFESLANTNPSIPSPRHVTEICSDNERSLDLPQITKPPMILNSSQINHFDENYHGGNQVQYNEELAQSVEMTNIEEQLPEVERTTVQMEISYVTSFIQLPINHPLPLASSLGDINAALLKQHATEIIDDNHSWRTYEKAEETLRMPIIVDDTEWTEENVQIIPHTYYPNLENAQHTYPETLAYGEVEINLPEQLSSRFLENTWEMVNDEQVTCLSDDSYLLRHCHQSNIHIDPSPDLEKPPCPTTILTLNYAHQKQSHEDIRRRERRTVDEDDFSSISSFLDMEIFLNHFEESLDHEQHLPLIDQISLSYATSFSGRYEEKNRSLPVEWFQPTILSYDEQLVEQWTVVTNIDTIQQEGTLRRQQSELLTTTECVNIDIAIHTEVCLEEEISSTSTMIEDDNNHQISDSVCHYSDTSDYQIDSVDRDNDTTACVINSAVIIPTPLTNIHPSSSITTTTLLSQSSPLLTSSTAPVVPIVYFLDALAIEPNETNHLARDFLLTIGFGQNEIDKKMNEITNTVSTIDQLSRATWISRAITDNIVILPTIIHQEKQVLLPQKQQIVHFATENQLENDDTALLIHPYCFQYGYELGENIQEPLSTFFEPSHLHLPIVNEIYIYQMSFHHEFSLFHPPDILPHILVSKTHEDEMHLPNKYQIKQPKILSLPRMHDLLGVEEDVQAISLKLDQPTYIEHCHIQPLYPFSEICYAQINQPEIISKMDMNLFADILLPKLVKNEDEYELNSMESMNNNRLENKSNLPPTVTVEVRPSASTESGRIYEDVSIEKNVDVNIGRNNQYNEQAKYKYGSETDASTKENIMEHTHDTVQGRLTHDHSDNQEDTILVPETIIEHISEDEKSTSSEEVVFEEWSERFRCRRTDEYDPSTKQLIRSSIDQTSDRVKGDVVKEEYKGKNVRIKGHKSYDVVKQVHRRVPAKKLVSIDQVQTHVHEEVSPSPPPPRPSIIKPTTSSSSLAQQQPWTTEEIYTTEVLQESNSTQHVDSNTHHIGSSTYDQVRSDRYSPAPSGNQQVVTSADYHRVSEAISPTIKYTDKRKEDLVSEEYHVEFETTTNNHDDTSGQRSPTRRQSDWRNELKQMYASTSSENQYDQYEKQNNGNHVAQRITITPSRTHPRVKQVQINISAHHKTPPERRRGEPSPSGRYIVKEVLVRISRSSSPEKHYHHSLIDDYEPKKQKKTLFFDDYDSSKKIISTSTANDDRVHPPRRSPSSSSILDEHRTQVHQTDRPTLSRVGVLRNTFESTTNGNSKDDTFKYRDPISPGLIEQRRKLFEEQEQTQQEWTRRPPNERRTTDTHTGQSLVSDRISRFEHTESKPVPRGHSTERTGRTGFDAFKLSLESMATNPTPQTSMDIKMNNRQVISSIDSDFGASSQPIYHSTPKSTKQHYNDDAGHESEDELSEPKQDKDARRRTSQACSRDFSQSISPSVDTSHIVERKTARFDERSMGNVLAHVPPSKGKGVLIELSPDTYQSPTKAIYERNKSNITLDSGVFDRTATSHHLPNSSTSWRNNVSTSIDDDGLHTHDNSVYIATTAVRATSPYTRRPTSAHASILHRDDPTSQSAYRYDRERFSGESMHSQPPTRNVHRQITHSSQNEHGSPTNYRHGLDTQKKVPITTQSRSTKPLVFDEIETIETETQVECQVQRTNETKESTTTERTTSPISPSKIRTTTTTTSQASFNLSDEKTPAKRVVIQERPQYYEPIKTLRSSGQDDEQAIRSSRSNIHTYGTGAAPFQVISFNSQPHITFDQNPSSEIVATVRISELANAKTSSSSPLRQRSTDRELDEKMRSESGRYQNVHTTNYRSSPVVTHDYQHQARARVGPSETANHYSSPINYSSHPTSYQSSSHEQKRRSQSPDPRLTLRSQAQYHSRSLGNLDFEIEIEKRPPQQSEQPTVISLDQSSRAIVTTSKDGRVSIQNIAARPGNTIVINSDFHASDRSLNRSSGYFSSDEMRSQGPTANYSSDEQSSGPNLNSVSASTRRPHPKPNEQTYHFDQVTDLVHQFAKPSTNSLGFNETIDQIDALYTNLDVQSNTRSYDFSKSTPQTNRRKQLELNPNEYTQRFSSTGFQQTPSDQYTTSVSHSNANNNNNNSPNWASTSSLNNLVMSTSIRPSQSLSSSVMLADQTDTLSPNSGYGSIQNMILHQNRLNGQSQIVQRNRASVKQVKQKNAARKRNGQAQEPYSDDDDDSPSWTNANLQQRPQSSSRSQNYNNH